jgi:hypothetical protein
MLKTEHPFFLFFPFFKIRTEELVRGVYKKINLPRNGWSLLVLALLAKSLPFLFLPRPSKGRRDFGIWQH